jgi:hypothetical protein
VIEAHDTAITALTPMVLSMLQGRGSALPPHADLLYKAKGANFIAGL